MAIYIHSFCAICGCWQACQSVNMKHIVMIAHSVMDLCFLRSTVVDIPKHRISGITRTKSLIATIVASVEEACGEREEGKQAKRALTELPGAVERAKARCADYASARSAFEDATRTRTLALADASALGNATVERSLTLWCDAHVDRTLKKLQGTLAPFRELAELCTTIVAGVAETVTHDDDAANAALARAMPLLAGLHRFAFRA